MFIFYVTIACLFLVAMPIAFALIQFARYKANGGKRRDFIQFIIDYIKQNF